MSTVKKYLFVLIVLSGCIGCDQVTKLSAIKYLNGQPPVQVLGDFFRFEFSENTGAMLSMGSQWPSAVKFYIFIVATGIILVAGLCYVLLNPLHYLSVMGLSLFIGGGIGNLWDRICNNGAVVDFMIIEMGPLRTGIFNVADVSILTGAILLSFSFAFFEKMPDSEESLPQTTDSE